MQAARPVLTQCVLQSNPRIVSKISLSPLPSISVPVAPAGSLVYGSSLTGLLSSRHSLFQKVSKREADQMWLLAKCYALPQDWRWTPEWTRYTSGLHGTYWSLAGVLHMIDPCIIPCQFGNWTWNHKDTSQSRSILWSSSFSNGTWKNLMLRQVCFEERYCSIGILVSLVMFSAYIYSIRTVKLTCLSGFTAASIPIPWNAPFPSIVIILWSAIPAVNKGVVSLKAV